MRRNNRASLSDPASEQIVRQIRVNIVFEQLLTSVLLGAGVGLIVQLILNLASVLLSGLSIGALVGAVLKTAFFGFSAFLAGFIISIVIITPMFFALERAKRNGPAPYIIVAIALSFIIAIFLDEVFVAAHVDALMFGSIVLVGAVTAADFVRRMRPIWRHIAEQANAQDAQNGADFTRLQ